jgi:hypothetical protein
MPGILAVAFLIPLWPAREVSVYLRFNALHILNVCVCVCKYKNICIYTYMYMCTHLNIPLWPTREVSSEYI